VTSRWAQTGGDLNPKDYGAVLTRHAESSLGEQIEIVHIDPDESVMEYHVQRAEIPTGELTWQQNAQAARANGRSRAEWEELPLEARAEDRLMYWGADHLGGASFYTKKWSEALPARSNQIKWWR